MTKKYRFSVDAQNHLRRMFAIDRHPRNQAAIIAEARISLLPVQRATGEQSVSHSLNLLALYIDPLQWEDTRPPALIKSHTRQMQSTNNAEFFNSGRALWSYLDYRVFDDDTGLVVSYPFSHIMELNLTPSAQQYYAYFAKFYKMRALNLDDRRNLTALVAATLEAIGQQLLTPPSSYIEILKNNPNQNKIHAHAYHAPRRGNPDHIPFLCDEHGHRIHIPAPENPTPVPIPATRGMPQEELIRHFKEQTKAYRRARR